MGFFSSIIKPVVGAGIGLMTGGLGGAAVGAGLGLLGNSSDSKQQAAYNQQMDFAQQQFEFQKDYAKSALQWRVEDAKKAGVHPMAALGMSSPSFSPVSTPAYTPSDSFDPMELGQSINYAATKAKSRQQQAQMVNLQMRGLELDNEYKQALIDNMKVDTLASSIASNQAFESPAAPMLNQQEPTDLYIDKPIVRDGWLLDEKGRKVGIIPSEDAASRFEDKLIVEWVPFAGSAVRGFKGKFLGQKVNGHWWHGDDKGFLPYPPKKGKGFGSHVSDVLDFYRDYDG